MRRFLLSTLSAALILMSWAGPSHATLFTGSSGTLSASADFDVVGGNLQVTLTNTSTADVLVPGDVLTAVFFNLAGNPILTPLSAVLASGSTVFYDPDGQPAGGNVGGEWAYNTGFNVDGATQGISSTGLGLFGPPNLFPGPDLQPPNSPDGVQYGLLSAGDNPATGNAGVTGSGGLILNSVIFTLSGLPTGFDLATGISNVLFQYGTDLSETRFPGNPGPGPNPIPEPSTIAMALTGLVPLGLVQLRRRRRQPDVA